MQVITDVVPEIFYNAQHPIAKLSDGNHAGFTVRTRVYLWSPSGLQGKLRVAGSWGAEASVEWPLRTTVTSTQLCPLLITWSLHSAGRSLGSAVVVSSAPSSVTT